MNKNLNTKEKSCMFYVSDYHFEMISLPYISKKLEENNKIIILTDNDLKDTINNLVKRVNLKDEKKKRILSINWSRDDKNKLEEIKKEKNAKINIFIKGDEKYINETNKKIEKIKNDNIKIVDCYNIENMDDKIASIMAKYNSLINTTGEKNV